MLGAALLALLLAAPAWSQTSRAPANDNFSSAQVLSGAAGSVTGTTVQATKQSGEPNHAGNAVAHSVWYRWTAPSTGTATVDTVGSSFDTELGVYTGSAVSALNVVASNDDISSTVWQSRVTFTATAGTTYRIAVDGWRGDSGSVKLSWSGASAPPPPPPPPPPSAPANDAFAAAQAIGAAAGTVGGSTVGATKEPGEPNHAGNAGGRSVWFSWTAPNDGTATLDTIGSSFNTLLAVYTGASVAGLAQIASNDDISTAQAQSRLSFAATGGTTYRIVVDGSAGAAGSVTLTWLLPPPPPPTCPTNDAFSCAQAISGLTGTATGTNEGASKETGEPNHAGSAGGHSVWYRWTAPASGAVAVDTTGTSFDSMLGVYTGSAVGSLTAVASNDDISYYTLQSRATFTAVAGTTYQFAVDGYGGATGTVALAWTQLLPSSDPQLLAAGDVAGCDTTGDEATAAIVRANPAATVATIGDNVHEDGRTSLFTDCYAPSWGAFKARTRPSVGNHEYMTPGAAGYFTYFGTAAGDAAKGYYSYDLGSWHVVVLNSNCTYIGGCGTGSPEESWLRADLAAHPAQCTLAYWHHARFSSGSGRVVDDTVLPFWQALSDYGADLILSGHHHAYERFAPQTPLGARDDARGIREIVAGTGGYSHEYFGLPVANSQVRVTDEYGVVRLTLHPGRYDWEFLPEAGQATGDSGSTACH